MRSEQAAPEPANLKQALIDFAQELRDNYRIEPNPWVLPAHVYDEAERRIAGGTATPGIHIVMRNAVRAEEWSDNE